MGIFICEKYYSSKSIKIHIGALTDIWNKSVGTGPLLCVGVSSCLASAHPFH